MTETRISAWSESRPADRFVERFCGVPRRVRPEPYHLGLLEPGAERLFLDLPFPFPREFWLAERDGVDVARIGASVSPVDAARGAIGFLELSEGDEQAASELIATAESWLRQKGADHVIAPLCFNTWFPYRYRIGPDDGLRFSWEPVQPPGYPELLLRSGYAEDTVYASDEFTDLGAFAANTLAGHDVAVAAGYTFRPLDPDGDLEREIPILHDLSMRAFARAHLIEPIPLPVFQALYVAQARKRQVIGSYFACAPGGEDVGFTLCFEDEAGQFVIKTLAVVPEHQGRQASQGLLHVASRAALARGLTRGVGALAHLGNRSQYSLRKSPIGWHHEYALFRRALTG